MTELENAFKSLFEINMGVRCGERIVVFSDKVRGDETLAAVEAERRHRLLEVAEATARFADKSYGLARFLSYPATAAAGAEPPEELWRGVFGETIVEQLATAGLLSKLLQKQTDDEELRQAEKIVLAKAKDVARVVVALANNSTSHTRFRALVNRAGGRFASLPSFDPEMFFTSMRVDWQALADRTHKLSDKVNQAVAITVVTPNGTRMHIGMEGRQAAGDDGLLTKPGSFGNLPAGEVYLAPLEGTSEGRMVIEYSPLSKLASPLELEIEKGKVVAIRGDDPYRLHLEKKFTESDLNRNIAELGIGTNDRATRPDNILEAEKILGTIHIALGDNSGFGGRVQTPFHEDYVFYRPTVTALHADGSKKLLLDNGKLFNI